MAQWEPWDMKTLEGLCMSKRKINGSHNRSGDNHEEEESHLKELVTM
jgi:hypothetical protein